MNGFIPYLLVGLLAVLGGLVAFQFRRHARSKADLQEKRRCDQVERERLAEQRMIDNGGFPLSARAAARKASGALPNKDRPRY